jgi:type IV secretion system protein VirB11
LYAVSAIARDQTVRELLRPIQPHLDDPAVTELSVMRPGAVWTLTREGWQEHPAPALSWGYLQALITAILAFNGLTARPIRDAVLPGGERCHIVLPPAVIDDTLHLTIRKHMPAVKSLAELEGEGCFAGARAVESGARSEYEAELQALKREGRIREFLARAVALRRNIVIAGPTGSGKTTVMRSLLDLIPTTQRPVTIEDVHELAMPRHPLAIHMLYGEGAGRVTARECVRSAMRQSPDRLILAEMRGPEAAEYLESLNTGHPGGITSVHANSAAAAFARIVTLVRQSEAGRLLSVDDVMRMVRETVDVVLYMEGWKVKEVFYDPTFGG